MKKISPVRLAISQWKKDGTKMLGTVGTIIPALLTIEGLIPKDHMKYWLAAGVVIGALTVRRGYTNTSRQDDAVGQQSGV
jgi:hypothetical protein